MSNPGSGVHGVDLRDWVNWEEEIRYKPVVIPADPGPTPEWHGLAISEILLMGSSLGGFFHELRWTEPEVSKFS